MRKKKDATGLLLSEAQRRDAEKQIKERQREVRYDIRDFVIDYIVQEFRRDQFYIPDYQREFVWHQRHRRRFIESVLLGLPIPMMFLADLEDGRLEIVDGAQRIQTLAAFLDNNLQLEDLERLPALNGFKFHDLPVAQQRKFGTKALRIVVLDDTTTPELRREIFQRINTSGEKARPSEVRRGAYTGPFMDFLAKCAKDPQFLKLCPFSQQQRLRQEPQELLLRFFAYSDRYKSFRHDVTAFLDQYVRAHRTSFDRIRLKSEFKKMLTFVATHFPHGFAKNSDAKSTPRVRFEAISVGINLALREIPRLAPRSMTWLQSENFEIHTTTHASNSAPRLRQRVEYVRNSLLEANE